MTKKNLLRVVGISVVLLLCGCEYTVGYVYVDNGGSKPVSVTVDGKDMGTIAPGSVERLTVDLGPRQFRVTRGKSVVYNKTHKIDSGDRPYRIPQYVLNPDGLNRYCEVTVIYGTDKSEEAKENELMLLMDRVAECRESGDLEELASLEASISPKVKYHFKRLSYDLNAFGNAPFFQFEDLSNILTPVASTASVSYTGTTQRSAMIRVPKKTHDSLADALRPTEPTLDDLAKLLAAERQALQYLTFWGSDSGTVAQKD